MAANNTRKKWLIRGAVGGGLVLLLSALAWQRLQPHGPGEGIASGNGRIEATEIDIAAKTPGRLAELLVQEGDFVKAGQLLARMDTAVLEAQLREAQAQLQRARVGIDTAQSQVHQREAEKLAAEALVTQRQVERVAAQKRTARTQALTDAQAVSVQQLEDDGARYQGARSAVSAAQAQVAAAEAALSNARGQVIGARAAADAAEATVQRIQADIDDSSLRSPRDGRVQYRVVQAGEVLSAGAPVLNLVDLGDVYMTFFLPTAQAGRVAVGSEVHLVLDAAPQYVLPARVSFVADVAQFTPKTVETAEERLKLMFRVKARIDPVLLQQHLRQVKTGLPGMAYLRLDPQAPWPEPLQIKLPQ